MENGKTKFLVVNRKVDFSEKQGRHVITLYTIITFMVMFCNVDCRTLINHYQIIVFNVNFLSKCLIISTIIIAKIANVAAIFP